MKGIISTIAGALVHGTDYFIYPGHFHQRFRRVVETPAAFDLPFEEIYLTTCDGAKLHAYLLVQEGRSKGGCMEETPVDEGNHRHSASKVPTVLILHGNGDNIGCWLPHARQFYREMGCNVFMLEYRGFGKSDGRPSELGLQIDAQTALEFIDNHADLQSTPIILYGQSLGGAVAIDLASRFPSRIRALILENTPLSLCALLPHKLAFAAPLACLLMPFLSQRWDSAGKLASIVDRNAWWRRRGKRMPEMREAYRDVLPPRDGRRWSKVWNREKKTLGIDGEDIPFLKAEAEHDRGPENITVSSASRDPDTPPDTPQSSCHSVNAAAVNNADPPSKQTESSTTRGTSGSVPVSDDEIAILMLSGLRDTIVPPSHMRTLWGLVQPDSDMDNVCSTMAVESKFDTVSRHETSSNKSPSTSDAFLPPELLYDSRAAGSNEDMGDTGYFNSQVDFIELSTWSKWSRWSSRNTSSSRVSLMGGGSSSNLHLSAEVGDRSGSGWSEEIASKSQHEWRKCHFVEFEWGGHNDTSIQPGYWCVVANFISNL